RPRLPGRVHPRRRREHHRHQGPRTAPTGLGGQTVRQVGGRQHLRGPPRPGTKAVPVPRHGRDGHGRSRPCDRGNGSAPVPDPGHARLPGLARRAPRPAVGLVPARLRGGVVVPRLHHPEAHTGRGAPAGRVRARPPAGPHRAHHPHHRHRARHTHHRHQRRIHDQHHNRPRGRHPGREESVMTDITNVTVFGTGVLGSQIIMQAAYHGKTVTGYDISDELLAELPERWEWMRDYYRRDLPDFDEKRFAEAIASIRTTTDIPEAVADADLVIEAVPENLDLKKDVWTKIGQSAPEKTIFATNASTLRPSDFAAETGRPEKFLALHFANLVWRYNTGEVMVTPETDKKYFDIVLGFTAEIGLVPVPVLKETPGYLLNGLLVPWLSAGAELYVNGIANPADIDNVWRTATGSPAGPFQVYDTVGFNVAAN